MSYKNLIYIVATILISSLAGGGFVYLVLNHKTNTTLVDTSNDSKQSQITLIKSSSSSLVSSVDSVKSTISSTMNSTKASEVSIIIDKDFIKPEDVKPTGQKFLGWLGSTNIEMYLDFKQDKITGKYYNSYDKKWYNLDGTYQGNSDNQSGTINLSEFDGNLINGNFYLNSQNPPKYSNLSESSNYGYNNFGVPAGLYYTNKLKTLTGNYNEKNGNSYDVFVSSNQSDIDNFVDQTNDFKVVRLDSGNSWDSTILEQAGRYFFTYEDWMIPKDIRVGDKVLVTSKIRSYNGSQGYEVRQWSSELPGIYESTTQGLFQISEFKKI